MGFKILDHNGDRVRHGKAEISPGFRLHYYTAGSGPAVLLLHGVPKTSYYWRKVVPHLTSKLTVICPDMRGIGDSNHPKGGMDMSTVADDFGILMTQLGHEKFHVAGEDWGAAAGYQVAARHRARVMSLIFQEMILPGFGLENRSHLSEENVSSNRWLWHVNFYAVPDVPELLITGREREYFSSFMKNEAYDPASIDDDAMNEYIRCYSNPGGLRNMLGIYRATLEDAKQNRDSATQKLEMPVLAIGAKPFLGDEVCEQMKHVANQVTAKVIVNGGHHLAEECPMELSDMYLEFLLR